MIGLAYLDGIDVEKNTERGIELITSAAEANLLEAMKKLYDLYINSKESDKEESLWNPRKAMYWAERIVKYYKLTDGEEAPVTLTSLNNLASTYSEFCEYIKALKLQEKVYLLRCKILGKEHPDTLTTLNNLASTYNELGDYEKALETAMKLPNLYKARENALVYFLQGEERNKVAKEALIPLAWVIVHHLTALCETENNPKYLRKASQILDILFDGENEDNFIKSIRQKLQLYKD